MRDCFFSWEEGRGKVVVVWFFIVKGTSFAVIFFFFNKIFVFIKTLNVINQVPNYSELEMKSTDLDRNVGTACFSFIQCFCLASICFQKAFFAPFIQNCKVHMKNIPPNV